MLLAGSVLKGFAQSNCNPYCDRSCYNLIKNLYDNEEVKKNSSSPPYKAAFFFNIPIEQVVQKIFCLLVGGRCFSETH